MVVFFETTYAYRDRDFCEIMEFLTGNFDLKIHVISSSTMEAARIDGMLWTFKKEAFIPHVILGPGDTTEGRLERVFITVGPSVLKGCDVLVLFDPDGYGQEFESYRMVVVFIIGDDESQKESGRKLWRRLGKADIPRRHVHSRDKHAWMNLFGDIFCL
ncbi:MAG: DNA polymerase III subunit chi [Thermodesulforhabdaceae bacterium]